MLPQQSGKRNKKEKRKNQLLQSRKPEVKKLLRRMLNRKSLRPKQRKILRTKRK